MTADLDLIRRAASQMREGDDVRWHRVADLLDGAVVAALIASGCTDPSCRGERCGFGDAIDPRALAVARAFLKEDA